MQLGEVYFDIVVNESSINSSINNIKNRFKTQKLTLEAVVQDKQLTALNKHLDLKKKHWDEVRTHINNNPIIAKVDYTQVNNLKKDLAIAVQKVNLEIRSKIEHTVKNNGSNQTNGLKEGLIIDAVLKGANSTNKEIQILQRLAKQENKERKSYQKSTQKETQQHQQRKDNPLLSPITGSISGIKSLVTSPINNIVRGALERVGAEVTKNLGQGISVSVEDITAPLFGSTKEIGRQLTNNLFSSVHQEIPRVEKELNNFFEKLYTSQKSKGTGKFKLSILESLKDTFDGNGFENLLKKASANLDQANVIVESLSNTANKINLLQERIKSASPLAHTEYISNLTVQQRSEELKSQTETALEKKQRKGAKLTSRISTIAPPGTNIEELSRVDQIKIVRLQRQLTIVNDEKNVLLKQLGEIKVRDSESSFRGEILKRIALTEQRKKRQEYTQLNPEPKGLQASAGIYERLARTVIKDSGLEFDKKLLPAIRPAGLNKGDRLGVTEARYDYKKNIIEVPKELYDAAQTNTLTSKQISTLIHELRHAAQFNLGRDKTGEAIQALTPEPELLRKIAPLISRSVDPNKKSIKARDLSLRLETDAYTYQHQKASTIEQDVKKSYLTDKFNIDYGVGGGSGKNSITGEVVFALRELQNKAKTLNVDVSSELQNFITLTDKISTIMSPLLDKAANLDVLPIDELESFYDSFGNKIRQFTQIIQQEKESLLGKFTELESDNVKTNLGVLGKGEVLKISHKAGLSLRQTDKKADIINALTSPDNIQSTIQALSYRNFQVKDSTEEINSRKQLAPSELKKVLKDKRLSIAQQNKQAIGSQDLIGVSSELQKEYNIVLGLLSSDLDKDTLKIVQNAKLNLGKLRKSILRQTLIETKKTKVQQTQFQSVKGDIWDDTSLYSFGDIEEELKLVKTRIQEFLKQQAIKISKNNITTNNNNLIGKTNTSNTTAQSTLNKVGEAQLKQQNSVIQASAKEIEKQTNSVFKNFAEFFESRVKAYSQVLQQIDNNIGKTVSPDLTIPIANYINPPLSMPDSKTHLNKNTFKPQQKPLIEQLVLPILNARKESAIKNAQSLTNNIPGLSANLITSSAQHKDLGDNKQSIQLYREYKKLDSIRQQIEKSLSKPFVSFTPADTQNLEELNEQGLKIFRTFSQDIPQDKGLLSFLNNNILKGAIDLFSNLGSVVKSVLISFISFNIGQAILPQLQQFLVTSVQVSKELENIKRILDTSSDNTGLSKDVTENAKALKISIKDSLESATEFTSAVEGTTISGEIGQKVFSNFQKYFAARGGSKDQQQRANLQLEQIAALGQITYPDLKPLAQAVPGISGVLARSQGITPGELRNRLTTDGGLGNDALVQFSQQAAIEAQTGLSAALDTTNAATTNLENSFLELQVRVGDLLQPSYKATLNILAGGLGFISDKIDLLGLGLANIVYLVTKPFAIVGYKLLGVVFSGLVTQIRTISADLILQGRILASNSSGFRAFGSIAAQGFASLVSGIKGVAVALAPMVLEFAAVSSVIVIIDQVIKAFQDLSGATGKLADNNVKNLNAFKESLKGVKSELGGGLTDDKFLRARRNASRDFNPLSTSYKESQDTTKAVGSIINTSRETMGVVNNSDLEGSIEKVLKLDRALIDVQNKRKASLQINPDDLEQLQRLNKEQIKITNERYKVVEPVSGAQAQLSERIEALKNARKALEALKNEDNIDKTTYLNQSKEITDILQPLESLQNKITKAVGETISAYGYLKRSIELVNAELEDTKLKQEKVYLGQKQGVAERLDISQATRNLSTNKIDTDNLIKQRQNIEINASLLQAQLQQPSAKSILDAYKITDNTEEGTLKYLADKAPDSSKFILEQQSKLVSVKKEVAQLNLQIAEARLTAYNQQVDLTKSIADYYVGIANQAEISAIDTKKLIQSNRSSEAQNKLRKALEDGHDNIVTQYVESIIESLGQNNNVSDKALEAQRAFIQAKQTGYDQQKAYTDNKRLIPEGIYTQPVNKPDQLVDFPKISTQISKPVVIDTINANLKKEAVEVEKSLTKIDLLKKEFSKGNYLAFITTPLDDLNKAITNEVIPKFKQLGNDFYQSIKNSSDNVVGYLKGLDFSFLSQSFTGLGYIFTDLARITTDWFNQLLPIDELSKFFNREFTEIGRIFNNIIAITSDWFNQLIPIDEINKILHQSFTGIGLALQSIGKDTNNWVNSIIPLNDVMTAINQSFLGLGLIIDDVVKKTQEWFGYIQQALGGLQQGFDSLSQGTQNLAQDASTGLTKAANGFGESVKEGWNQAVQWITGGSKIKPTGIVESVGGSIQKVKTYSDLEKHHPSAGVEVGRSYDKHDGRLEEVRNVGGQRFVKKDFVLEGGRGAAVPSPVGGIVSTKNDNWNTTHILDPQTKQILATFLHLSNVIKSGTVVKPGDRIGSQSDVGSPGAVHVHAEMVRKLFEAYIPAIISGNFTKMPSNNVASSAGLGNANMVDSRQRISSPTPNGLNFANVAKKNNLQSVLVTDLSGNTLGSYNADQSPTSPASTIKLVIADLVTDRLNPNTKYKVPDSAIAEGSNIKAGDVLTIGQLITNSLKDSDNTSANALVQALGGISATNKLAEQKGYSGTQINSLLSIPNNPSGGRNVSTANDVTKAFVNLLRDESPGGKIAESALRQTRNFKYQGEVGGKIGNNSKVLGNVGIVEINGKEYIVTEYANVNGNIDSNRKLIRNATNDIRGVLSEQAVGLSRRQSTSTNTQSSVTVPGLTPLGNKYANLLNDPRVRSFLRAIAIAEVGETLVNAGKGYGKQIGGNYSKEEFSNPEKLTRIPASLPGRGGQSAFGRYQFHQPDLVEGKKIGVRNLSPQNQDIIAVQKLAYRGALEPLLKGDISTAIKKAGNEWASLAGSKYAGDGLNATTAGGKLPAFMRNYQQGLNNNAPGSIANSITSSPTANNVVKSALQYRPVSNTNLKQTVDEARQIQLNTTNQQQQAQQIQAQQDLAKEKDDYIRKQNAALRTFQRAGESLDDSYITRQRNQTDLSFQNKKNPSPNDTQNQDITRILRQYDDLIRDNKRGLRDSTEAKSDAEKSLATGEIPEGKQRDALKERLAKYNIEITSLQKSIPELEKLRGQAIEESEKLFKRDETLRIQNTNFELRTQELARNRSNLEVLKTQSGLTPYRNIALEIPALEHKIQLEEADLELERAIADIEEKRYKNTFSADLDTNNKLADEQIELLKKNNISKQEGINLTFQQADANAKLEYGNKILERENTLLGIRNDMRQEELKTLELIQKRNPLIRAGEQLNIQKSIDDETRKTDLVKKQFDIINDTKLSPLERLQDLAKIGELYRIKERNTNEQFALDSEQQNITNLQTLATRNTSQRDFLSRPGNELVTARANQITNRGGNQFEVNALQRPNARLQENNRYAAEIDSFNSQAAELKFQGLITDEQITKMREALEVIHNINLENVNEQFKTFGSTIDDIAKSSIKGLSSGLADVILKGGSLTDVFLNFADTLLSGVLQTGLDSLLSSLTGSLFGAGGGKSSGGTGGDLFGFISSIFGGGGGLGGVLGFASGGEVPFVSGMGLRNTDTALGRALKREGHDAVLSTLTPGERVLTKDENRLYNALHPDGIMNIKVRNFNKGGELIPSISESVMSGVTGRGSTNVAVNASIESQGGKAADERQLAKSIRAVVIAELSRQDRIKNA